MLRGFPAETLWDALMLGLLCKLSSVTSKALHRTTKRTIKLFTILRKENDHETLHFCVDSRTSCSSNFFFVRCLFVSIT